MDTHAIPTTDLERRAGCHRAAHAEPNISRSLASPIEHLLSIRLDGLIDRYVEEFDRSVEEAERCYAGWLQFMIVTAMKPGTKIPSPLIDDMWHTALLFTADYRALCEALGRFIDHEPIIAPDPDSYMTYIETREYTRRVFGTMDDSLWPSALEAIACGGCGSRTRS